MEFTAEQIAQVLQGEIVGNAAASFSYFSPIEQSQEKTISFVAHPKFIPLLSEVKSSVVIISKDLYDSSLQNTTYILVEDAQLAFQKLLELYQSSIPRKSGIEEKSFIHAHAKFGENLYVGAFAYIDAQAQIGNNVQIYPGCYIGEGVKLGDNVVVFPNVTILKGTIIGNNCTIHAGTVIGSDGFGFTPGPDGYAKVPHLGNVVIEDDVEIGSNCTIDRGTMGNTLIKKGTKLDNLIQIAHNVQLGEHNVIAAQAGIAGSTKIGQWNMIGGQVGIAGHITIGNQIKIQAQSGVSKGPKDGTALYGSPALEYKNYIESYLHFKNIKDLVKRIETLENQVKQIKD